MRVLLAFLGGCMIVACQGKTLTSGTVRNVDLAPFPQNAQASQDGGKASNPTKAQQPVASAEVPIPSVASVPVAIAGANLVCIEGNSLICTAKDAKGLPLDFQPSKAFYTILSADAGSTDYANATWSNIAFALSGDGGWTLVIPDALQNKALTLLMLDAGGNYLAGRMADPSDSGVNLVADGSFENQKINPLSIEVTRDLLPALQLTWKASIAPDLLFCVPILELSSALSDHTGTAAWGSQWLELTAPCELGLGTDRNVVSVAQGLQLIPGHRYVISFSYRSPLGPAAGTALKFVLGSSVVFDKPVATGDWTRFQTTYTATTVETLMAFSEGGAVENHGTAIDDVSVIDMESINAAIGVDGMNIEDLPWKL